MKKKRGGETRGGKGEGTSSPTPVLPVYKLTPSPLTALLYYLSSWSRLLSDTTSLKAFGQILLLLCDISGL